MITLLRMTFARILLLILIALPFAATSPVIVSAQFEPLGTTCFDENGKIRDELADSAVCNEAANQTADNPLSSENGLLIRVANFLAIVTAVIAVIIIVVAGLMMVLSSGDSAKIASSRDTIIYAAVGLVIVALARSIVVFVVNRI